ncbi:MAG: hypothetical protein MUC71_01275 [Steroidobacteraceae bacterium]|jgi:hypothetical protein|nr:hypothetical protein [Steroidobacteraceae bacterium]
MDHRLDKRDWSDWVFAGFAIAGIVAVSWLAFGVSRADPARPGPAEATAASLPAPEQAAASAAAPPVGG